MSNSEVLISSMIQEIVELTHSSRYIAAKHKWDSIDSDVKFLIETCINESADEKASSEETAGIYNISPDNLELIRSMIQRSHEVDRALSIADIDSSWVHGITYFGITTHYKMANDGTIVFRLEGVLENLPIFEQCAVIHEIDLFKEWIPFCSESTMIDKLGNAELISYIYVNVMGVSRDTLFRAYGADCLQEQGKIVIIGDSIDQWKPTEFEEKCRSFKEGYPKEVPKRSRNWRHERMDIRDLVTIFQITSPNTAKTIISARVNLHSSLPQSFINFIVKNVAGVGLYLFQQQAQKVAKNHKCSHYERIHKNKNFYLNWVYPKLRDYCISKGWEPPVIAALLDDDQRASIGATMASEKIEEKCIPEHV